MNQSNKALRDEVAEGLAETFALDMKNKRGIEYAAAYQEADRAIALVTNHIKGALPEKFPEVGVTQNQIDFARGYNQALDEIHQLLRDMGAE